MSNKGAFLSRLKYGKHKFHNGDEAYAMPHINPDGSRGGWVAESAVVENTCHVAPTAEVCEYAYVSGNARIMSHAVVSGFASVKGNATLDDWAQVTDDALVEGEAVVCGVTYICGRSHIDWGIADSDELHDYLLQLKDQKIEKPKNVRMA